MGCWTEKTWKNDSKKLQKWKLTSYTETVSKINTTVTLPNLWRLTKTESDAIPLRPRLNLKTALSSERTTNERYKYYQWAAVPTTLTMTEPRRNTEARSFAAFFFWHVKGREKENKQPAMKWLKQLQSAYNIEWS